MELMNSYNPTVQTLQRENKKLRAENTSLKAELAEAKKDAGRYIAKRKLDFTRSKAVNEIIYNTSYDRTVDYVIDEAMKGK